MNITARYKGRLLSSLGQASSQSGSQRRFARDVSVSSVFYLVYESAGKIWLTYTTDGGTSWQPERFIEDGTRPSLAPRDNGVAVAYTVTDGAYTEVKVRLFSLDGTTLSETAHLYSNDWNAIPTASPAIVWLGNTFSQNPVLNNLPRYAVVYETPATQGGTDLRAVTVIGSLSSPLPTTLSNSEVALANVQLFPAIDAMIPSTNYSPQSVQARLVYRQRSGSDGWLRYQPLTFNFFIYISFRCEHLARHGANIRLDWLWTR